MKIKQMYLEDAINTCKKLGFNAYYSDETGIYSIPDINIKIKKWNGKIELGEKFYTHNLNKFMLLYEQIRYWVELEEKLDENK